MSKTFTTKDSGDKEEFTTGSQRDTQVGKTRYDLIPPLGLRRVADIYGRGADKYDDWNWAKGQPYTRVYASLFRHLMQWRNGDTDEDHMAAVAWAALCLLHFDETDRTDLDDRNEYMEQQ